jgi:hypothetical protein
MSKQESEQFIIQSTTNLLNDIEEQDSSRIEPIIIRHKPSQEIEDETEIPPINQHLNEIKMNLENKLAEESQQD